MTRGFDKYLVENADYAPSHERDGFALAIAMNALRGHDQCVGTRMRVSQRLLKFPFELLCWIAHDAPPAMRALTPPVC